MFPSLHDIAVGTFQSRRLVLSVVNLQLHGTTKAFRAYVAMILLREVNKVDMPIL